MLINRGNLHNKGHLCQPDRIESKPEVVTLRKKTHRREIVTVFLTGAAAADGASQILCFHSGDQIAAYSTVKNKKIRFL